MTLSLEENMLLLFPFLSSITSQTVRGYCDRQSDLLLTCFFFSVMNSMLNEFRNTHWKVSSHRTTLPLRAKTCWLLSSDQGAPVWTSHAASDSLLTFFPSHSRHVFSNTSAECENRRGQTCEVVDELEKWRLKIGLKQKTRPAERRTTDVNLFRRGMYVTLWIVT